MKKFKLLSMTALALTAFMFTSKAYAEAQDGKEVFTYDYEFNLIMPEEVQNGENEVIISKNVKNANVTETNLKLIYKVTTIDKTKYEQIKAAQEKLDAKRTAAKQADETYTAIAHDDPDITAFDTIMRTPYKGIQLWCDKDSVAGKFKINTNFCGEKYVVVSVRASDETVETTPGNKWEYQVARAYHLTGTKTDCDPKEEPKNPDTGISSPIVICGTIALGAIVLFVVSKKKRFI